MARMRSIAVKVLADTTELESAIAGIKPSDYEIRLASLDRTLGREAALGTGLDIIKTARRFERYLRGEAAE